MEKFEGSNKKEKTEKSEIVAGMKNNGIAFHLSSHKSILKEERRQSERLH